MSLDAKNNVSKSNSVSGVLFYYYLRKKALQASYGGTASKTVRSYVLIVLLHTSCIKSSG